MTKKNKGNLEHMIDMALAHGYSMNKYLCCIERAGAFMPPDPQNPSCHPLETVVVGQPIKGYLNCEIAKVLGVSLQWVDGFIDGYAAIDLCNQYTALDPTHPDLSKYIEGYQDGELFQEIIEEMKPPCHKDEPF